MNKLMQKYEFDKNITDCLYFDLLLFLLNRKNWTEKDHVKMREEFDTRIYQFDVMKNYYEKNKENLENFDFLEFEQYFKTGELIMKSSIKLINSVTLKMPFVRIGSCGIYR